MYYRYNYPMNFYRDVQCEGGTCQIAIQYFINEISNGHQGHFYKTRIASPTAPPSTVQLVGVDDKNNLVHLNVFTLGGGMEYMSVDAGDLYTITYLGPTPPPQQPVHRPPWCVLYPWYPGC